jgi:hypothetical protein
MADLSDIEVQAALVELDVHLGSDRIGAKAGLTVTGENDRFTFRVDGDPGVYFLDLDGSAANRTAFLPGGEVEWCEWRLGKRGQTHKSTDWPKPAVESEGRTS